MLHANYQDGRSTQVRDVALSLTSGTLAVLGDDIDLRIPVTHIIVDERLGSAPRRLRFPDGSFCEVRDLKALDTLLLKMGHRDGWVDRVQRHLPFVTFSIAAFVAIVAAAYMWLLPWAAEVAAHRIPSSAIKVLSTQTLKTLDRAFFTPSELPEERRTVLVSTFKALQHSQEAQTSELLFRNSPHLGANAFALPDGTIVVLDDLITLMDNDEQILAVLSHELGHVHERHGLQMLLRTSVAAAFLTFYIGDISALLAAAPAAMIQAQYSQEFERAADSYGAQLLVHNGISADQLADALENLQQSRPVTADADYLSTHPRTDERVKFLREQSAHSPRGR